MTALPHLAARVFGTPLLMSRAKLDTIMGVLLPRFAGGSIPPSQGAPNMPSEINADGIAVIPVYGTLVQRATGLDAQSGLTSYVSLAQQIKAAAENRAVKGIILDIDSPGGEASGVFDLAQQIYETRKVKPIWAVANEEAFSAAYALAAAASKIYVPRTGGVGSIGVIAVHLDQSQADEKAGLTYTAIYAGAKKNDLSPHQPLSDPARTMLQSEVDRVYELFAGDVARMRGLDIGAVKTTEAGLYFGKDAVTAGLADVTGNLNDALGAMAKTVSRAAVSKFTLPKLQTKEKRMSDMNQPVSAEVEAPTLDTQIAEARKAAAAESLAYAAEVAELCQIAGMPDKAAGFIAKSVAVAEVRKALLTAKAAADEASAITGHIPANNPTPTGEAKIDTAAIYASRNATSKGA